VVISMIRISGYTTPKRVCCSIGFEYITPRNLAAGLGVFCEDLMISLISIC
jgi:hypothetical protein